MYSFSIHPRSLLNGTKTDFHPLTLATQVAIYGAIAGAAIGSFTLLHPDHLLQILYSAIKVPMLLMLSFALSVPTFYVLHSLLGLHADFRQAMRAVISAQAALTLVLASLSPFAILWYASNRNYDSAILFDGLIFFIATLAGRVVLKRSYKSLIKKSKRHAWLLISWTTIYSFIAIQMAYVLRPFVGNSHMPAHFFRAEAWGNAYVIVFQMITRVI